GKSRAHVTNTLRLLNLPEEVRQMVVRKELTMGQVRPLVTVEDPAEQIRLAKMIKNMDLSARQAEMLAKRREETPKPKPAQKVNPELKKVEHRLQSYFGTKVKVSDSAIAISYKGYKDLNRILEILDLLDEE
ncbi:MAG: chromosome partitioning protein ParB, partial [Erysipelotrichales bacterium]|nr:chromosome partitioning protein ParB [Erysipelotrichales bacterium]